MSETRRRGRPVPHSRPAVGAAEARAVARVVRSRRLAQGLEVARFEEELAARLGRRHAVALSSGTAGLHLALVALAGDRPPVVLAPTWVCVAVLNAIRYVGGREILADTEQGGLQVDPATAPKLPARALAVIPHLFGHQASAARRLAGDVPLIEDCAMALGAVGADGRPLGGAGRCAVYSFYATKTLAAGEGGAIATDDGALAAEIRDLRSYDKKDDWRLRYNYKLTDLQAALLRPQLRRLDRLVEARRARARRYFALLDPERMRLPPADPGASWFRFVVEVPGGIEPLLGRFRAAGIEVARPVHAPLHHCLGLDASTYPRASQLHLTALSLPIYPALAVSDQARVARILNSLPALPIGVR